MRETDFIQQNKEKWERYEASLKRSDQDPELLNQLYVHTTDDLSISRTFYPNRSVRVYLNGLAQRTFLHVYRGRRGEVGKFFSFWTDEMPRTVYASRKYLLIALGVFVLSMAIGVLSYRIDPAFAETILGVDYVAMTEANIASGDPMAVYKSMDQFGMSLHITLNNILVAFLTFIAGALACVGTLVALIRNGVMLGVFQYFFLDRGDYSAIETTEAAGWGMQALSWVLTAGGGGLEKVFASLAYMGSGNELFRESLLTIWIHGALEISSIVIAGGAGLTMGAGMLFPGTLTRFQSFARSARAGLKIMLGTVPLFIVAGFLEGYVTRQTDLPDILRFIFILLCFVFIVWYYVIYPRSVVNRKPEAMAEAREPLPVDASAYRFASIRSVGEQLTSTFGVLRDSAGRLVGGALLLSAVYCLFSFGFGGPAQFRYEFQGEIFGDVANFHELLTSFGKGRSVLFSVLVAAGFYGMFRLALAAVARRTDLSLPMSQVGRELRLFGVCALLALIFAFSGIAVALMVFLLLPFLIMLGAHGYLVKGPVSSVFRLTYTNVGFSYGLVALLCLLAFPIFWVLDSTLGDFFFTFFDWVIYTDGGTIDARNVMLQTFCYYFLFALIFISWVIALTLSLGTLREVTTATDLNEQIAGLGSKRRLRGLERE